ncbi:Uncharacterized protein BM_BM17447 [Brugia malayi]|uniref:Uncharacterized protein n=2 Tax=Brugia TaxID=6278 RepID=A0A4E9F7G7_BRUMA|nr:Uncharacterized protein BM_BM17447 [Brugia malayi]VIO92776.1 Uncharacterized protein BM_BM17447 [Brugia malayi]
MCNGPITIYINSPFWNWFIEYHPKWIAPNVLTVLSFVLIVLPCLIILYYDYDLFNGPVPSSGETPVL